MVRESLAGYRRALAETDVEITNASLRRCRDARVIILPASGVLDSETARSLDLALREGACVLVESAAAFLERDESEDARESLRKVLGLPVEPPVDLWTGTKSRQVPYVDFVWPHAAKVRDFSRVIPVRARSRDVIGHIEGLPVAARRRVGKGTLIFLGSLLGPALAAGDPQACRWLRAVVGEAKAESPVIPG